ncbi:MAG: diacylglycerol kinase [Parcubacteria group bacterium CG11_big_fil_rev_8_21_14_0_20_48_46]|nr:MAG: diacylglycerol kinase [Parcubacteria group bacterium CG11_big_fil_rev_8_21_14_0_20_48_46]
MYRFYTSFRHAWHGLVFVVKEERNFRFHLAAAAIALLFAHILRFVFWEYALLLVVVGLVLLMEIINTVCEKIIDMTKPRLHFYAGMVKDMMAAAVLIAAVVALAVGWWLFWPHLSTFF